MLVSVFDWKCSQGSVVKHFRCGGTFYDDNSSNKYHVFIAVVQIFDGKLFSEYARWQQYSRLLVLVLVVDERFSFSAVGAHIFTSFIKTVLEDVDWWWINDILWQSVPFVDYSVREKCFLAVVLHLGLQSSCECPLNSCVSKAGWKNWLCPPFPFR